MTPTGRLRGLKLWLLGLGMFVTCVVLASFLIAAWTAYAVSASKKPDWLGNSPENVRRLTESADPNDIAFYATGDVKEGTLTFEKLLRIAAGERPDFLVVLGDFVSDPEFARHQLFAHEMEEQHLPFPVFLLPGNHDVHTDGQFRLEHFEQAYGPAQFHFTIGKCLFLFLNNAPGHYDTTGEYLRFMDRVLSEHAAGAEHVFVFMHVPPAGLSPLVMSRPLHGSEEFLRLARKHRVDCVFTGDHHGYWKGERDGTTYTVCGGGGAHLRGKHGRFHHAVRVAVEGGRISDSVVAVERLRQGLELTERNVVLYVWPLLTGSALAIALTSLGVGAMVVLLIVQARHWRRLRAMGK